MVPALLRLRAVAPRCPSPAELASEESPGNLLERKVTGPHPLTFPGRSRVGLRNVFFFFFENWQCALHTSEGLKAVVRSTAP